MIGNPDSLDKLQFFAELTNTREVEISPGFFRDFTGCLNGACGGCCKVVTLDYLEGSERWKKFQELYPEKVKDFKERQVGGATFHSNLQEDNKDHFCMYLNKENGLCTVHQSNPLGCSLPMVKFLDKVSSGKTILISTTYGRQWMFKRVNGEKGGICKMTEYTLERTLSDISKLKELEEIIDKIGIFSGVMLIKIIRKLEEVVVSGELPTEKIIVK